MNRNINYYPPEITGPRFGGIKTFMRLPNVKTTEDVDVAIVGVPFDTGASYKTGARFGPTAIREASTLMRNYSMNLDVNIFDYLSCIDYGDILFMPFCGETELEPGKYASRFLHLNETAEPGFYSVKLDKHGIFAVKLRQLIDIPLFARYAEKRFHQATQFLFLRQLIIQFIYGVFQSKLLHSFIKCFDPGSFNTLL